MKRIFAVVAVFFCISMSCQAVEQEPLSMLWEGLGTLILCSDTSEDGIETAQLLLKKPGGMREVIDTFDGLEPADLKKFDLDTDNSPEIIALLRHPDGIDVIPYIYRMNTSFQRIFPPEDSPETAPIICRELVLTANERTPLLCAKNLVNFHEFGPPDLFQLEFYRLNRNGLELFDRSFSEGDHFNLLMNRGALAFNEGKYLEALDYYENAISSSSGDITTKAYIESLFFLAESRKFTKDFNGALEIYQRLVLEFEQNAKTEAAQKEIELLSAGLANPLELSFLIDVMILANNNQWEEALSLLTNRPPQASAQLGDRFLFCKAEILTAQNRIEDAIVVFKELKQNYPESPLVEEVDQLLLDMQDNPEEFDGI